MLKTKRILWIVLVAVIIVIGGASYMQYHNSKNMQKTDYSSSNINSWKKNQFKIGTIEDVKKAAKTNNVLVLFTNDPSRKTISENTKKVILELEKENPNSSPTVVTAGNVRPTTFGLKSTVRDEVLYPDMSNLFSGFTAEQISDMKAPKDVMIGVNKGWTGESADTDHVDSGAIIGDLSQDSGNGHDKDSFLFDLTADYYVNGYKDRNTFIFKQDNNS
ncbi:hypothetical protein [Fructobacillus cardui]|uniref:hypothetical protein n=1 Tax=Fructobacillus cardui TaxID=2893170 RepID=UPI00200A13CF|nr:hypothetical protein [Fructobacillus cardui]MCK8627020.1 hypothetical protein [Fructobacillus cardui]